MEKLLILWMLTLSCTAFGQLRNRPLDFVPKGYCVFDKITGDLNKDGIDDCVLIIKATDSGSVVTDEYSGRLDRNRRGIVVLLRKDGGYALALENDTCFSSENEDGGVYFPPELSIDIERGNLLVLYSHGRYGYWQYTFRYDHSDFDLIGYDDSSDRGPIVEDVTSINFLTHKKEEKVNVNENAEGDDEVFETTWTDIKQSNPIRLSEIRDFDELDMSIY